MSHMMNCKNELSPIFVLALLYCIPCTNNLGVPSSLSYYTATTNSVCLLLFRK